MLLLLILVFALCRYLDSLRFEAWLRLAIRSMINNIDEFMAR